MIFRPRAAVLAMAVISAIAIPSAAGSLATRASAVDNNRQVPGHARVLHDADGRGASVADPTGRPIDSPHGGHRLSPREAARGYLQAHGRVLGLDGSISRLADLRVARSATGHVVRGAQYVAGLPVFGGEVVLSLDGADNLLSMAGETTAASSADTRVVVSREAAQRIAVATTAKAHRLPVRALDAAGGDAWLYDAALVGTEEPTEGAYPVWRFEVAGRGVHDLVLVDARRGGIAMRVDKVEQLSRRVCDKANQGTFTYLVQCNVGEVRNEQTGMSGNAEVDAAFDNIGRASDLYASLGRDLGETVGVGNAGARVIEAWVRWCFSDQPCPMDNAFWDNRMVLGDGYAGADDVIAHELTHGVIDHTSKLLYLNQSGAINESLADIFGEIVDQRTHEVDEDDSAWLMGEDTHAGALRSMADPTLFGQPDRMSSPLYGTGDAGVDSGDVHTNSGIGNKTAYLISQGGTFNGVTVAGIDTGDATLTKTATLYHEVMTRLTSGAEYDDLARTLTSTCAELAAGQVAAFTAQDCTSVADAIAATELLQQPASGAAPEVSDQCPAGQVRTVLFRDDDNTANAWTRSGGGYNRSGHWSSLWTTTPSEFGFPSYAQSGTSSWFGVDPDPYNYGDSAVLTMRPTYGISVPIQGQTYLHFHHAYVLEWYPANGGTSARYDDGASVPVWIGNPDGTFTLNDTTLDWVNGPDKPIGTVAPWIAFGGDSHGWGSSRLELTPLAGKTVHPQWRLSGDGSIGFLGWYVDDIEVYNCRDGLPAAARDVKATGTTHGAKLTWTAPDWAGTGITGYRITRSDGQALVRPASARSVVYTTLPASKTITFQIAALNASGQPGPEVKAQVVRTKLTSTISRTRVGPNGSVRLKARLSSAINGSPLAQQQVVVQERPNGAKAWSVAWIGKTRSDGTVVSLALPIGGRTTDYRVLFRGAAGWVGSTGMLHKVIVV